MSSVIYGKFEKLAHSLRGGSPIADINLYGPHIPGEAFNSSGVDDPKLTEMIKLQRRTLDVTKRREIVYDIQRYLAEQVYYAYDAFDDHRVRLGAVREELRTESRSRLRRPAHGRMARPLSGPLDSLTPMSHDRVYCPRRT